MVQNISECKVIKKKDGTQIGCGKPIPTKISLKNYRFYSTEGESKTVRPF